MDFGAERRRAKSPGETALRLWRYLGQRRAALVGTVTAVIFASLLTMAAPYLMGQAIDTYIAKKELSGLAKICGWMLAAYLLGSLLTWLHTYIMASAAQQTVRAIRRDLFGRLQQLPLKFFDTNSEGDLMSRLTNDVEIVSTVLSESVPQIVSGVLTMVGVGIAMFVLQPILAVVSIVSVAIPTYIVNKWLTRFTREGFRKQQQSLGALNSLIEETISGQRVVKAFRREAAVTREFDEANGVYRAAATRAQTFAGVIGPIMNLNGNIGMAFVAGAGGILATKGMATVGLIAMFMTYARQFATPLMNIGNLLNSILSAVAGAERVFETIDEEPEIDVDSAEALPVFRGEVVFENVTFGYVPGKTVLANVNLKASPGQTVALIGPTGAGKTTIINLLTRFYEIDSGRILIDGRDLREFPKSQLRPQLGIVLQDTYLFAATIRENIRYGRLEATEEEIVAAAKLANVHPFVQHLPDGYDTVLTERGSNLSHGQRQMLAIARAILADPRILILDEATSSVDTRTERQIQEAMLRLMEGRTSFVIAHRLSTVRDADQILAIKGGEVVERGTHQELIAAGGYYASMQASARALG